LQRRQCTKEPDPLPFYNTRSAKKLQRFFAARLVMRLWEQFVSPAVSLLQLDNQCRTHNLPLAVWALNSLGRIGVFGCSLQFATHRSGSQVNTCQPETLVSPKPNEHQISVTVQNICELSLKPDDRKLVKYQLEETNAEITWKTSQKSGLKDKMINCNRGQSF